MSTQAISDYLTKQIFIEKNIVTFRQLSRQFSLHVNTAKNELATYHHNAPYQSQSCSATFLISGVFGKRNTNRNDEDDDYNMDQTPDPVAEDREDAEEGDEEDDSEEVVETCMTLVNEKDLEAAKEAYDEIFSHHVYSLSPAPLIDAALVCDCAKVVRSIDKLKNPEWAATVGRIVGDGIKIGISKKGKQPTVPRLPIAGPSKPRQGATPEPAKPATIAKPDVKVEPCTSTVEKQKGHGKLNFFMKPKEPKLEEAKKVKKDDSAVDVHKMMFFSKPAEKAPTAAVSVKAEKAEKVREKEPVLRGVKRKSSVGLKQREKSLEKPAVVKEATAIGPRARRKVILSEEESDDSTRRSTNRKKSRASFKSDSSPAMDSEAEREARALMDIDDDQVERVSHAPSTSVSELGDGSEPDRVPVKMEEEEDVDMVDDTAVSKPQKKRKAKAVIPVGQNGLKKRKVTKTKYSTDAKGYSHREDYTDWESVDEEEPQSAPPKAKGKPKVITVKKEEVKDTVEMPQAATKDEKKKGVQTKKTETASKPTAQKVRNKTTGNVKTQKGLMNFFGPGGKKS